MKKTDLPNYPSPANYRQLLIAAKARRTLLSAGYPPLPGLIQKLIHHLLPPGGAERARTTPVNPSNSVPVDPTMLVDVATNLKEDTDLLQDWREHLEWRIDLRNRQRRARQETLDRRLRQLIARADSLSRIQQDATLGISTLSNIVNITDPDYIDYDLSNADVLLYEGMGADGEVAIPRDAARSYALRLTRAKLLSLQAPAGSKVLGDAKNLFTPDFWQPFQIVLPGTADDPVTIDFQLDMPGIVRGLNGIEIRGACTCHIAAYAAGPGEEVWLPLGMGMLSPLSRTVLRFDYVETERLRLVLSNPQTTPRENGEVLGIRTVRPFLAYYAKKATLITQPLLTSAAPLKGVKITADAITPPNTAIDLDVSFVGTNGPWQGTRRISRQDEEIVIWNGDTQNTVSEYPIASPTIDTRIWSLPANGDPIVPSDAQLFVGINQWYGEAQERFWAEQDYPYRRPVLTDWDPPLMDRVHRGAVLAPTQPSFSGSIATADWNVYASSVVASDGFMALNQHQYGTEDQSEHLLIMATDGVNTFMREGWEYHLTTWVHCTEEKTFRLAATVPGGAMANGTICFALYINQREVLSAGDQNVANQIGFQTLTANASLIGGWNQVDLLLYRPDYKLPDEPVTGIGAAMRLSFTPTSTEFRNLSNISQMRFRKEALTRVSEFTLRVLRNPGNRAAWAWEEGTLTPVIYLPDSWGHDASSVVFDGISAGRGATFRSEVRLGEPADAPAVWVRTRLIGQGDNTPRLLKFRIDAL